MGIPDLFKSEIRTKFIELMNSERGLQSKLAKSIGKKASYFSEIKRGSPVNAFHLKAVGIVFGPKKVIELLGIHILETECFSIKEPLSSYGIKSATDVDWRKILERIATIFNTNSVEFTKKEVGISDNEINRMINENRFPASWACIIGEKHNINPLYLLKGIEPIYLDSKNENMEHVSTSVDTEALAGILKGVEEAIQEKGSNLDIEQKAVLSALLYDQYKNSDSDTPSKEKISQYLKLAKG